VEYIKNYKMFEDQEFIGYMTKTDADAIQTLLYKEMYKDNVDIDCLDWIYNELELIKKDADNSCLFSIIQNYYKLSSSRNIIYLAMKFFDLKYKDVITKFKEDRKKEFNTDINIKGNFVEIPFGDGKLTVPRKIGHDYLPVKALLLSDLNTKFKKHRRLKVFYHKGCKCVSCDKVGVYLIAGKDKGGAIHIDLYTKNFELMTIDHIKPRGKGGSNDIENLDPMCETCNSRKADKYEES